MSRTRRRDAIEQEKHKAKKVARSMIRLQHSLMADDVLNQMIPGIDDAVDLALSEGRAWQPDVAGLIKQTLGLAMPTLGESQ